ncbi:hypothetical protein N866_20270 [Actinotalea ferrariae CF5-4]|uniref:Aminoglycoside phosphotransferase domain-containing protein n=1 Tax=Actinotalea ferrariae CF5-4 TaxID=948458 RepID=A0A021VQT7_9CELL|nr:aminoglycoside phosphotransferase family protein [Actinotalea ferrariae]EYR63488.1 hypothetical protein N866_20270 [Actinotalea ferrariae CF5-4]
MGDGRLDARGWAAAAWPDDDWSRARVEHGAFHEVLVLPTGPVARLTDGRGHRERTQREAAVTSVVAGLDLGVPVPTPLSEPVTADGVTGVLVSRVAGEPRSASHWSDVRHGMVQLLDRLRAVHRDGATAALPPVRSWCGGASWPALVREQLAPRLPPSARSTAARVVADVLEAEAEADACLVHGDLGLHNVLWPDAGDDAGLTGLIDVDHAAWADPAVDVAPLVGAFGVQQLAADVEPDLLHRAMVHRATLSLQVAAAAELAGRTALRDHALATVARRVAEGTLYEPHGLRPHRRP